MTLSRKKDWCVHLDSIQSGAQRGTPDWTALALRLPLPQYGFVTSQPTAGHDLQMLEIDASEVERHPEMIDRILRREIFGVIVRGVFAADRLTRAVAKIEQDPGMPVFASHTFAGRTYGRVLRMADGCLDEYFAAARRIGPALDTAFGDGAGYQTRLREIVGALGGGRPVSLPSVGERTYAPATVRVLDPGGTVHLHCGNETHKFPPLSELVTIIDPAGEISTLMPLALPEGGGELDVYDVCFGDPLIDELDRRLGREHAHQGLTERRHIRVKPAVGDLALFEEGRHYHRVTEVQGARSRWTMGGFLAPSRDSRTLHYWS
jgi:hypothetical protein